MPCDAFPRRPTDAAASVPTTFYFDLGVPLRVPDRGADQRRLHRGRARAARVAADPARRAVPALRPRLLGQRPRPRGGDARRSSGAPPRTGCRRFAGRSRCRATRCSRCGSRPSPSRPAAPSPSRSPAFRQAFAAGRDLTDPDNVLIAAAACELHPRALQKAVGTDAVKGALREATDEAAELGVFGVPSLVVGERGVLGRRPTRGGGRAAAKLTVSGPMADVAARRLPPVTSCSRGWR